MVPPGFPPDARDEYKRQTQRLTEVSDELDQLRQDADVVAAELESLSCNQRLLDQASSLRELFQTASHIDDVLQELAAIPI